MFYIKIKNAFSMRLNSVRLYISPPWVIRRKIRKHDDATYRFPWQYVCDGCCCHGVKALIGNDCCNILQLAGETFLYGVMRRLAFGIGKAKQSNVPYPNRSVWSYFQSKMHYNVTSSAYFVKHDPEFLAHINIVF